MANWNECLEGLYWGANKNGHGAWERHGQAIEQEKKGDYVDAFNVIKSLNTKMQSTYEECVSEDANHFWNLVESDRVYNPNGPSG